MSPNSQLPPLPSVASVLQKECRLMVFGVPPQSTASILMLAKPKIGRFPLPCEAQFTSPVLSKHSTTGTVNSVFPAARQSSSAWHAEFTAPSETLMTCPVCTSGDCCVGPPVSQT
jgi:hypothetical protein